jgi:sulfur-oxidizing protein SoxY
MALDRQCGAGSRRGFLRRLAGWVVGASLWRPAFAQPKASVPAPEPDALRKALAEALHGQDWTQSDRISLEVPQMAENGAIVPVTVESHLPDTQSILLFAERNPGPLLARFDFEPGADGWVSLRVKLNESGPMLAIAESRGRFYGTVRQVRVMVGGCG